MGVFLATTNMAHCITPECLNFGNLRRQGYCNHHANILGIIETTAAEAVQQCPYPHCHEEERFAGFSVGSTWVDGIELPCGFTGLIDRKPVPGDCIISVREFRQGHNIWLSNSFGRVAEVYEARGQALIHFACDSLFAIPYADFRIME